MNDSCLSSLFYTTKLSVLFDLPAYCSKKTQTKLNLNLIKHGFFIFSIEIFCMFLFSLTRLVRYSPVRIRRGVSNRRGGSGKISKTLQEGGHFLIRGGSDKPKMLQEGDP